MPVAEPIRYHVDLAARRQHLVGVQVVVPADLVAGARLVLPVWTPGSYLVRDYVHHLQRIRARRAGDGAVVALEPDGGTAWRLPADLDGPVEIELELYANDLAVRTSHVDDHHALLIPAATFPYVEGGEDRPHLVHLPPAPPEHRVWSLLPDGPEPDTYLADDRDHLIDSAFEVGDLPHVDVEVAGVPHTFVWAGHAGAPDLERIGKDLEAIARASADLFGGTIPTDHYTVLTVGWDEGGGGLEHRDGAVLQIPVHAFQDDDLYARFQTLLSHEYLHLWNVKRLVPAELTRPDYERPTRSRSLWVAEGWTAYYDELLAVRAELWTTRRFLDVLREVWERIRDTPGVALQSLRDASYHAWTKHYVRDENSPNAMTDYYGHGALVAWELDLRLRERRPDGDGLDEVLRLLWERHAGAAAGYGEDDVLAAIAEVGGDDLAALADERAGSPGPPQVDDDLLAAVGLRLAVREGPNPPDLGVVTSEDDRGVVLTSVLRGRPGWRAGLTGGDRLVAIDGWAVGRGQLPAVLRTHAPGERVEVAVLRGPRLLTLPVQLGEPVTGHELRAVEEPSQQQRTTFLRWTGQPLPPA